MSEYVVLDVDGRFLGYGPRAWVTEFPEARTFEKLGTAKAAARITGTLCEVVEDYGLDSQKTIETIG